jgi:peptidyl-prolyl cis-trans isomerase SurA
MTLRLIRTTAQSTAFHAPAVVLLGAAFFLSGTLFPTSAQTHAPSAAPQSPYGGETVEDIVARVNDQIISRSDYERVVKQADDEARQRGDTMQQIADGHKDLLRDLIDQQLWISKAKELDINVDTDVVKQLDEIRKKYNLASMDDLEKAAKEQGISYEDFKANIKNQLMTQAVMRQEVGRRVQVTPGEAERFYEAHKQDYGQAESIRLSEIMVSTGNGDAGSDDPQKLAAARAKADDIESKLKAGANFDQLARTSSDGQTAAEGGDMGKYVRGQLNKVFEDKTFAMKAGEVSEPIRTKQGYVIFKVVEHTSGGPQPYKDVQDQVEEAYYMSKMQPAIRAYLQTMREQAYIQIANGYTDSAATPNEVHPTISYSAYTPPAPKKKKKVERTRFRETEHGFRNKPSAAVVPVSADTTPAKPSSAKGKASAATPATMKAGKKEKIRYGQAPRETLPNATATKVEDAGALPAASATGTEEADNATPAAPVKKTRYSQRPVTPKASKYKGPQLDTFTPPPPDAAEVADKQVQDSSLGINGETGKKPKKKKDNASTGEKKRMQERPKSDEKKPEPVMTPAGGLQGAPAPATAPKPADSTTPVTSPGVTPDATTTPPPATTPQQ